MEIYNDVLNGFFKCITKKNLSDFLKFVALHPEVSLDNCALIYSEEEHPEEIPRYFVHKGQAKVLGLDEKPYAMLRIEKDERGQLKYSKKVMYPFDGDPKNDLDMRAILDRIGYTCFPSADVIALKIEDHMLYYPKGWNQEQIDNMAITFYLDYFWQAFKARYQEGYDRPLLDVTDESWFKYYREAVLYMGKVWLGLSSPVLSNHFWLFVKDDGNIPKVQVSEKRYRLTMLSFLFSEFVQTIEGEHFTLYETDIFRECKGDIYNKKYQIYRRHARVLDIVYKAMLERYYRTNINKIPLSRVHFYRPYQYPE